MFVAYTDASIKDKKAFLAFVIVFEDKSKIYRRIAVEESDSNIAEAMAIAELISFLKYYHLNRGLILFDSNGVKKQLKKKGKKIHKFIPKDIKEILNTLEIRTQVIPRKYNIAHRICYNSKFKSSNNLSTINRSYYDNVPDYSDLYIQFSVLEEYKDIYNKPYATFDEAQMNLNKQVWLSDLVEDLEDVKVYSNNDKRIKVVDDDIVKIWNVNYVEIGNHWRVFRRCKRFRKLLNQK